MSNANAVRASQSGPFTGRRKSASITPGAITTLQTVAVDVAMPSVRIGDTVAVSFNSALVAGIIYSTAAVLANGTVRLYFANITAGTLTQTAITANIQANRGV
jgi:hypothetical protein